MKDIIGGGILLLVVYGGALLLWDDGGPANVGAPEDYRLGTGHPLWNE